MTKRSVHIQLKWQFYFIYRIRQHCLSYNCILKFSHTRISKDYLAIMSSQLKRHVLDHQIYWLSFSYPNVIFHTKESSRKCSVFFHSLNFYRFYLLFVSRVFIILFPFFIYFFLFPYLFIINRIIFKVPLIK